MSEYKDFSSLPPDKEAQFVIYEKTSVESAAKAKKIGMIASGIFGVLVIIIVMSFEKPKNLLADDPSTQLQKAPEAQPKAAPPPTPPAPATTAPATTPATAGDSAPTTDQPSDAPSDGDADKADGDAPKDE